MPSMFGWFVSATLMSRITLLSEILLRKTGETYLYSLLAMYCFAFSVHSMTAHMPSAPLFTSFFIHPAAGASTGGSAIVWCS
ncbi:MAG: hypothetical protein A4E60_03541 [Syntrophorhabdus sp. PtaB.Bin047]|nr:MAG: hypothetical protein A4E60_03541 [Syntrophorhabdus sp. PtaB.Bin047]